MTKLWLIVLSGLVACVRPGDQRVEDERTIGSASVDGTSVETENGMAHVVSLSDARVDLFASAPVFSLTIERETAGAITIAVDNCPADAELRFKNMWQVGVRSNHPTGCEFQLNLGAGTSRLLFAPQDYADEEPFRFVVMGDIQQRLSEVDDIFAVINQETDVRFVMCTGDIVQAGEAAEYVEWNAQRKILGVPVYTTIGNHELPQLERWLTQYGRYSTYFRFKGVDFTFLDSGSASIDPELYDLLDARLFEARNRVHFFGTHYPSVDPVGVRNGSFRSRNEGYKLISKLAQGNVDRAFYGHIHSLFGFEHAGVPAIISGGGGGIPERLDGIGRHFLLVTVDPSAQTHTVRVVPID